MIGDYGAEALADPEASPAEAPAVPAAIRGEAMLMAAQRMPHMLLRRIYILLAVLLLLQFLDLQARRLLEQLATIPLLAGQQDGEALSFRILTAPIETVRIVKINIKNTRSGMRIIFSKKNDFLSYFLKKS